MIRLWRPSREDAGMGWPSEEELNRLMLEGWKIVGVIPAYRWSENPTVVLEHPKRWKNPREAHGWARVKLWAWWRWYQFKRWVRVLGGGQA